MKKETQAKLLMAGLARSNPPRLELNKGNGGWFPALFIGLMCGAILMYMALT